MQATRSIDPRRERTRRRLIDGGRAVMARKGIEAATVLEIVREARVSQPSFYNHFKSKDDLLKAIAADYFRKNDELKNRMLDLTGDPAIAIAANARLVLGMARSEPVVAWVVVRAGAIRNLLKGGESDPLVGMIQLGMDQGRFGVKDASLAASAIRGAAFPLLHRALTGTAPDDVDEQFALLVLTMLGMNTEEARQIASLPVPSLESEDPRFAAQSGRANAVM